MHRRVSSGPPFAGRPVSIVRRFSGYVAVCRLVEARRDHLANAPRDRLAHFFGTLVHEENEQRRVRMIDRDAFGDRVQQHRLAGASRCDDERALAVADGRDEIDRAARELRATLRGTSRLEVQLPLGIGRGEGAEVRATSRRCRILVVDLEQLDDRTATAVIATGARGDRVAAAETVLPDEIRRDVRVACVGEVAVRSATNEAAVARRIEPAQRLRIRNHRHLRLLRLMLPLPTASAVAAIAAAVAVVELLILRASTVLAAIVPMIAMVVLSVVTMLAVLARTLLLIAVFARGPLFLFAGLGWWGFGGRRR